MRDGRGGGLADWGPIGCGNSPSRLKCRPFFARRGCFAVGRGGRCGSPVAVPVTAGDKGDRRANVPFLTAAAQGGAQEGGCGQRY